MIIKLMRASVWEMCSFHPSHAALSWSICVRGIIDMQLRRQGISYGTIACPLTSAAIPGPALTANSFSQAAAPSSFALPHQAFGPVGIPRPASRERHVEAMTLAPNPAYQPPRPL